MAVIAGRSLVWLGRMMGINIEKAIIAGYSVCHWPGGQLRVSTLNSMVTATCRHPKDKSWSSFDSHAAVPKPARFSKLSIAKGSEESIRIAQDRLTYWKSVGAQASPTVERLIDQAAKKAA